MTEYTVTIHNPFASLLGMDDVPSESQPTRVETSKTTAEKKPQAKKPQANQPQLQGPAQTQQGARTNQRQGQQGPNVRQQGGQASSQQGGARVQGFPGQGARVNRSDQQQRNQQGQQQRLQGQQGHQQVQQAQQGGNQQRSGDQQSQGQKRKINYVPVVPNMTIEQRRPRFDRDNKGPREDRGNDETRDFRGDENANRGNRGDRDSFNYRGERPFGRPRREGGAGGQAGGRFAMDRHTRGGAGTGIKDNTKRRGAGAHQWGAEGSELEDIDLEQGSPSTPVEPLVKEGTPAQEEAATNSEAGSTDAEKKGTEGSEGEKKDESATAEGGEGSASNKKKKKKKKKKGDKEGDKKGKGGGDDSGEESDPNALKDDEMVLYEDFLKEKQDKASSILPKLPQARKGGEGVDADSDWNKGVLWKRNDEELVVGGKADTKKKQAGSKKEKKGPLTPELPIVFEMRDTRREDRGIGRGRRREGAAGEAAGIPQRERYGDRQRGGQFGGGRGNRGPRKFGGGRRAPNFDERSFPSLAPTSGNEVEGQANATQQSS